MKARSVEVKKPVCRHGDFVVAIVTQAIADIESWMNRRETEFLTNSRLSVRTTFQELRRHAQLADRWFSGQFESNLSFKECCEFMGHEHAMCVEGLYRRWSEEQIASLRAATARTDYDDLDAVFPGMGQTLIPVEDIDEGESTELADEDEESPEIVHDEPFTLTTEGNGDAGPYTKTKRTNLGRRRKLRARTDQRLLPWDGPVGDQDSTNSTVAGQNWSELGPDRN